MRKNNQACHKPIGASCNRIRNDQGYWQRVETYLAEDTNGGFTHGICPDSPEKFKGGSKASNPAAAGNALIRLEGIG